MPFHSAGTRLGQQVKFPGGRQSRVGFGGVSGSSFGSVVTDIADVVCGGLTGTALILCRLGETSAEALRTTLSGESKKQVTERKFDVVTDRGGAGPVRQIAADPECRPGTVRIRGVCVDPSAAFPGGDPLFTQAGGVAMAGAFGMPAFSPIQESVLTRRCPRRMVLGFDNLCYPKAVLPPRSQFRKWKRAPSPTLSRRDEAAIVRAASAKDRVLGLAKKAGLFASKTKPASRGKSGGHQHLLAAPTPTLRVISEERN